MILSVFDSLDSYRVFSIFLFREFLKKLVYKRMIKRFQFSKQEMDSRETKRPRPNPRPTPNLLEITKKVLNLKPGQQKLLLGGDCTAEFLSIASSYLETSPAEQGIVNAVVKDDTCNPTVSKCFKAALKCVNHDVVEDMITSGADVNQNLSKDSRFSTWPLFVALTGADEGSSLEDTLKVVDLLLKHGANINCIDDYGRNALIYCIEHSEYYRLMTPLIEKQYQKNKEASETFMGIAKHLIQEGIDLGYQHPVHRCAFTCAVCTDNVDIAKLIIEKDPGNVNVDDWVDNDKCPIIVKAAELKSFDIVNLLLCKGVKVNAMNNHGENALTCALRLNHRDIVPLLLNYGAKIPEDDSIMYNDARNRLEMFQASLEEECS